MKITLTGKQVDIGDRLRNHVEENVLNSVNKYFPAPISCTVAFSKDGDDFCAEVTVHPAKNIVLKGTGTAGDPYSAFDNANAHIADRLSVNVELPSERSLNLLAPDKGRHSIFRPMKQIAVSGAASREELTLYRHAPKFAPAGQSTQMIVGASPETDYHILKLTEGMYQKYSLKRVFYSAYIPVAEDTRLPALDTKPPLLREHRLYQADWLLRFYQFEADEILDQDNPNFNPYLDPKCNWAVQHYGLFPVDVNRAPFEMLLRVPGIGPKSARRIWRARKQAALGLDELRRMGVVLKRAQYFITCRGFAGAHPGRGSAGRECITRALIDPNVFSGSCEQLSLFSPPAVDNLIGQGVPPRAAVRMVREEAVQCLAKAL